MNFVTGERSSRSRRWWSVVALLIFLTYTSSSFGVYCARVLHGKAANHVLIGEMFGIPDAIKQHGVEPMYYGPGQTGWDGQFYYYMSNDLLGVTDTPSHVDAPSYRYQRVGLSLYVKTLATLSKRKWVSPEFYLASYFLLLTLATWAGSRIFADFGANPLLILFWSLSVGTQITLFNGLPDAAADAFLIFALLALFRQRVLLSLIPFALAGLSREVYVLFPICIFAAMAWERLVAQRETGASVARRLIGAIWQPGLALGLPVFVVLAWQIYVISHFHATPSSQAYGILGGPFKAWVDYFVSGLHRHHLLVGDSIDAYYESGSLLFFAAVLVSGAWTAARLVMNHGKEMQYSAQIRGVALALLAFSVMYACFGKTVIMHYTGYFKALAVFFLIIPILLCLRPAPVRRPANLLWLLALALAFTTWYNFRARLLPVNEDMYQTVVVSETRRLECINRYDASIKVNDVVVEPSDLIARLFGGRDRIRVALELTNTSDKPFISTKNFGSVYMSYQWLDPQGAMIQDGQRTALPAPLLPGQSVNLEVRSSLPRNRGVITMQLSPVQEGCAWFYVVNPDVSKTEKIRIKN